MTISAKIMRDLLDAMGDAGYIPPHIIENPDRYQELVEFVGVKLTELETAMVDKRYYLTIQGDYVVAKYGKKPMGDEMTHVFKNANDYNEFFEAQQELGFRPHVMCSSSLDFPEEYTNNVETIALCDVIRG